MRHASPLKARLWRAFYCPSARHLKFERATCLGASLLHSRNPRLVSQTFSYAQRQRDPRRHLISIALVVVLHGLLLWALLNGLARQAVQVTQEVVEALLIADAPAPAPAPPVARSAPPPKPLPAPTAPAPAPTPTPQSISAPAPPAAAPAPSAAPSAAPVRVGASVAAGGSCAKPVYPSASRRLEEEGTVSLRFLIGTDGHVLQSEIVKSSGFARLDEAARAALSKCQFRPGTVDGRPEQSWANIQYQWRLE